MTIQIKNLSANEETRKANGVINSILDLLQGVLLLVNFIKGIVLIFRTYESPLVLLLQN